ncbi:MAG TPA: hypothetical protein VD908_07855 [Cytophagales bacterium]|nr:hypothetical protein [Cytophagales bacterium]
MISSFKESYDKVVGIKEEECYDCLSYKDLCNLIRCFQSEKRNNFRLFMDCLQKQVEKGSDWPEGDEIDLQKIRYWKQHLHYESLVQWCFKETSKRTLKGKNKLRKQ